MSDLMVFVVICVGICAVLYAVALTMVLS